MNTYYYNILQRELKYYLWRAGWNHSKSDLERAISIARSIDRITALTLIEWMVRVIGDEQ